MLCITMTRNRSVSATLNAFCKDIRVLDIISLVTWTLWRYPHPINYSYMQ